MKLEKHINTQKIHEIGFIYKIVDRTTDNYYIGATFNELRFRLAGHVKDYKYYVKSNYDKKFYKKSFEVIKNGNYYIELLETFYNINKRTLHEKETEYIKTMFPVNEKYSIGNNIEKYKIKDKEYYILNKDKIKEYQKKYRELNKDNIKKSHKIHYNINKERILKQRKIYRELNKDKIKEYQKKYREYKATKKY